MSHHLVLMIAFAVAWYVLVVLPLLALVGRGITLRDRRRDARDRSL